MQFGFAGEECITIAEVLEKYSEGPSTGIFTDGSARPNPGPGGWGAVMVVGGKVIEHRYGKDDSTTNNRMELTALIEGYALVPPGTAMTLYTDSELCVNTVTKWAVSWERAGWKRKTGPIKNLDLVQKLYALSKTRPDVKLEWVRGHNGWLWNEYADALSTAWLRNTL